MTNNVPQIKDLWSGKKNKGVCWGGEEGGGGINLLTYVYTTLALDLNLTWVLFCLIYFLRCRF